MTTTTPKLPEAVLPDALENPPARSTRTTGPDADRTALSIADWRRPRVRRTWNTLHVLLLILLVVHILVPGMHVPGIAAP